MNQNAFHDDDPRRFGRRPPDFTSRAIKLRLFMLMAALVVVLIAMKEVQRPERWEWMGFDGEADNRGGVVDRPPAGLDQADERTSPTQDPDAISGEVPPSPLSDGANKNGPGDVSDSDSLWGRVWPRLDATARRQLIRVIRRGLYRSDQPAFSPEEIKPLVERFQQQCDMLERKLLERITLAPHGSDVRQALNQSLLNARDQCERQSTALVRAAADSDVDDATAEELRRILDVVESLAWADVVDHTPVRRASDGVAWVLAWQKVLLDSAESSRRADDPAGTRPQSVSVLQMMNQPTAYRGRWVHISGWIRGAQVVEGPVNELGIGRYYVVWLQTSGTETTPVCVYVTDWPQDSEPTPGQFAKMNLRSELDGVFFKIRTYQATDGEWASCPLVLARSFQIVPEPIKPSASTRFEMPVWGWTLFLISMPLVAGFVAWTVYRWTRSNIPIGGGHVPESLADLERDASILSPREQVERLEQDARQDSRE